MYSAMGETSIQQVIVVMEVEIVGSNGWSRTQSRLAVKSCHAKYHPISNLPFNQDHKQVFRLQYQLPEYHRSRLCIFR